jgi:hypothetical protein
VIHFFEKINIRGKRNMIKEREEKRGNGKSQLHWVAKKKIP